ncbi:MAG TPA: amino acid permease [Bryobacteraceae bacterium]|nr:amino acid permease [Bryobacteraceae bacterium]
MPGNIKWNVVTGKPGLLRQLGVISATALVVSNMIGTGIFTTSGFLAGQLGSPPLVLWTWVVGAVCAFLGAICYSELGINFPSSGGEYVYLTRAFGPTWGFMTGWVSFFAGFSAPIAAAALAFSGYLGYFFPQMREDTAAGWTLQFGWAQIAACLLVAAFTLLNVTGLQRTARVQNVLTAVKVAVLAAFVALGFLAGDGSVANFSQNAVRDVQTPIYAQFAISLFWIYVAYSGWNAATYVAEELRRPARTLPRALAAGIVIVTVLYFGLNLVFIYAAPLEDLKGQLAVGAFAASRLFGPRVAGIFSALMALSLMATVNAMVTTGPRVYYAMAKNGAFLSRAARVHPRWHTPAVAIVAQGICAALMTLTPFPQLVVYIGFTLNFFAVMSVISLFRLRKRPGWQKLRVVSFCYPLFPVLFVLVGIWMTVQGAELKPYISLAAVATVATGALVYHARWRSRAEKQPGVEIYGK